MKEKLVSVIMPVYNSSQYMKLAIDSILNQTYSDIELIIVNDGSTDNGETESIALSYENKVRYFRKENGGVASAINYGIERANGQYVARMDSDDIAVLNRIEKQVEFMESNLEIGVCGTQYNFIDEDKIKNGKKLPLNHEEIKAGLLFSNPICHPTVMIRRSVLEQGWSYDITRMAEDYDLWTRMIFSVRFANLSDKLLLYRLNNQSITRTKRESLHYAAANSAMSYLQQMFGIELTKYRNIDFAASAVLFLINQSKKNYIIKQFMLLCDIYERNHLKKELPNDAMKKVLNDRWKSLLEWSNVRTYMLIENKLDNSILQYSFSDLYALYLKEGSMMLTLMNDSFEKLEKRIYLLNNQKKKIIIYGMGIKGKRLLERYLNLKKSGVLQWELEALVDKKERKIEIDGKGYSVVSPENIQFIRFDYIVVPSLMYFEEIKAELIKMNIEESKIIDGIMG